MWRCGRVGIWAAIASRGPTEPKPGWPLGYCDWNTAGSEVSHWASAGVANAVDNTMAAVNSLDFVIGLLLHRSALGAAVREKEWQSRPRIPRAASAAHHDLAKAA